MAVVDAHAGIEERSFQLAPRVVKVVRALPPSPVGRQLGRQLLRAGTSVGANVAEAQAARSRKEFIRKLNIACGEARESAYWLRLIADADPVAAGRSTEIRQELEGINRTLATIVRKSRANDQCVVERVS